MMNRDLSSLNSVRNSASSAAALDQRKRERKAEHKKMLNDRKCRILKLDYLTDDYKFKEPKYSDNSVPKQLSNKIEEFSKQGHKFGLTQVIDKIC